MRCLQLGIVLLLLVKSGVADLVVRPSNAVTVAWTPVTFHCTTQMNDSCHWLAAKSPGQVPLTVYDGNDEKLDTSQYSVNRSSPGQCDLTVLLPTEDSSLIYVCSADKWLVQNSYASLVVLKSNLMCGRNVMSARRVDISQTVRYSFHLRYVGIASVSVYMQRPDGAVTEICADQEKDGDAWRVECDYADTANVEMSAFFAAVSKVVDIEGFEMDASVPTQRFYCSNHVIAGNSPAAEHDVSDAVQHKNTSSALSSAAADTARKSPPPCDSLISSIFTVSLLCIISLLLGVFIGICICITWRRCNRHCRNRSESQLETGNDGHNEERKGLF